MKFNIDTMYLFSAGHIKTNLQYACAVNCRQLLLKKQNTKAAICWHTLHMCIPSGNFSLFMYKLVHF